jgi:Kef-type K+ transport system membrane component KefB
MNLLTPIELPIKDPIQIALIIFAIISIIPSIAPKMRIPAIVLFILAGMAIGQNGLGILVRNDTTIAGAQIILLEKIGLMYIMALAGLQMNLDNLRQMGVRSLTFGLLTFGIPLTLGILVGKAIGLDLKATLLLGILFSPHTLVAYPLIVKLGLPRSQVVGVTVGGTAITSILTLIGLTLLQAFHRGESPSALFVKIGLLLPLGIVLYYLGSQQLSRRIIQETTPTSVRVQFILAALFFAAAGVALLGVDPIVGAFVAGLSLNRFIANDKILIAQIDTLGNHLFIPAFLIAIGMLCNPKAILNNPQNLGLSILITLTAVGGKYLAAWLAGKFFRFSPAEVLLSTGLTMSRAALVMVVAIYGKTAGILDEKIFNAVFFYILLTCLVGPLVVGYFGNKVRATLETQP